MIIAVVVKEDVLNMRGVMDKVQDLLVAKWKSHDGTILLFGLLQHSEWVSHKT